MTIEFRQNWEDDHKIGMEQEVLRSKIRDAITKYFFIKLKQVQVEYSNNNT